MEAQNKENKLKKFLLKHIFTIILLLALAGVYLWGKFNTGRLEKTYAQQTAQLTELHIRQTDSLEASKMQMGVKMLGWAVRSELSRNNAEQVVQFFNEFIKEKNVVRIDLVDPQSMIVTHSTDKKMEGLATDNPRIGEADMQVIQIADKNNYTIINPVMGLDRKLGILVVAVKR